ncbi:hypothetical protein F5Y03DRAFT_405051 [Xylaria venustula]|nr:hypothetical protein F5Y03DRAFT_405051 [Xylaria venustula]
MSYFGGNYRPTDVALLVFRRARDGNYEILVGSRPDAENIYVIPTRELEDDQPVTHAARCLSEICFRIELSATDVTFPKSVEFGEPDTGRVRCFYLRSTPEFDAVARDGVERLGWKYEFVHISNFAPPKTLLLLPGLEVIRDELQDHLDDFVEFAEPYHP